MKLKQRHFILIGLFFVYLFSRLYFAFQTGYFSNDESYFALRQIEHIGKTGRPLSYDPLSYEGKINAFLPFYYYVLSVSTFFSNEVMVIRIINNVLASLLIIAVYLISTSITKKRRIAIICSLLAATLPAYISETLNTINTSSLMFPASLLLIYFYFNLEKDKSRLSYLIPVSLVLVLSSPDAAFIVLGFLIFLFMNYLEKTKVEKIEIEFLSFFVFFFLWTNFIIYKLAFQEHGFDVFWGNIPIEIVDQYFTNIDITHAFTSIGIIPFVVGIYTIYKYLKKSNKKITLVISMLFSLLLIFFFRIVPSEIVFAFSGIFLVILFGQALREFILYINKTKFKIDENLIYVIIILLLIVSQIWPGVAIMKKRVDASPNKGYIDAFLWVKENTEEESIILGSPEEGHLISYFSERRNVIDSNYLMSNDAETRYLDVKTIYTTKFKIEAVRLMEKYNVDYMMISKNTKDLFGIEEPSYIDDKCFKKVYDKDVEIYKSSDCRLVNI